MSQLSAGAGLVIALGSIFVNTFAGTQIALIGVAFILLACFMELRNQSNSTATISSLSAASFQGDTGSIPMSDEQKRLMARAKTLIEQGKTSEAAKLLSAINHPKASEWLAKLPQ